jgi:hypothetical protein
MTKKDLFRLIIKIFGLYSIIMTLFSTFPNNVSWVIFKIDFTGIIWLAASVAVVVLLFVFLVFKPDTIIDWLKLDKGFDTDDIQFRDFDSGNLLKLGVIVIGGILLLQNVPVFLSHTLFAFKSSVQTEFYDDSIIKYDDISDYIYWLMSFLNIVIGYLLLTNYTYISRILKGKSEKIQNGKVP